MVFIHAFTWLKSDGSLSSPIDLIAYPSPWLHVVSSCGIVPCPFSDYDAWRPLFRDLPLKWWVGGKLKNLLL